jgi:hypothetical protein
MPSWLVLVLLVAALALPLLAWARRKKTPPPPVEPEPEPAEPAPATRPAWPAFEPHTRTGRLLVEYGRLQHDLVVTGQERRAHETPREHARRVSPPDRSRVRAAFSSLVPLIDDGLYGEVEISDDDLSRGRSALADLKKELG